MLTIDTHFIRAPLRRAEALGIDVDSLLEELGISREIFSTIDTRVHAEQYVKLIQKVWVLSGDEFWGLSGERCKTGHFSSMVRSVRQYDTLGAIAHEVCRFYNDTRYDIQLECEHDANHVNLYIDLADSSYDTDNFLIEFFIVTIHRFMCWISGKRLPLISTQFAYPKPRHASSYYELFPGKHVFNAKRNCFTLHSKELGLPKVRDWAETREFLSSAPAGLLFMPGSDESYTTKIKTCLQAVFKKKEIVPDFDRMAENLGTSTATLRRNLQAEDASYQQIKDVMRRDIAIDLLVKEKTSIAEIAFRLGFTEPPSFTRAFKQWTGVSPKEYRSTKSK
ncbi:MAG: AraC family transcriptional regulator [Pseudomonadales bacterium]|nr:AraC family transcriptional regulator [Pseudomonadales bacterium]